MTLFEVGVCIAIVMVLAILFLPALSKARRRPSSLNCVNNLKQLGLAYRIWAGDNGDMMPMGISVTKGGSMEMVATGNVEHTFIVMSNELSTPKILFCPQDTGRIALNNFSGLANANISYFVGVDATNDANPQLILSGDGNFQISVIAVKPGLLALESNTIVQWSGVRHVKTGNLGLSDGSVQSA